MTARITGVVLLYCAMLGSGVWLTRSGRPYNMLIVNVHKLIALAAVVFTAVVVRGLLREAGMRPGAAVFAVAAALLVVALLATCGLLATGKLGGGLALSVHRVAPALLVVATAALLYVLVRSR
jgi:hypothetical protein